MNAARYAGSVTRKLSSGMTANKATAIIIWLVGAWLTAQAISQLGVPDPMHWVFGMAIQWVLTKAESPLWRGKGYPKMAVGATLVDTAINSAGAWPYVKNIGQTDFWAMIREIGDTQTEPTKATIVAISFGVGVFTAAAAEYFWNLD